MQNKKINFLDPKNTKRLPVLCRPEFLYSPPALTEIGPTAVGKNYLSTTYLNRKLNLIT